jgi:VWFA-related protein
MTVRALVPFAIAALVTAAAAQAPPPQQAPPTFRSGTILVPVNVRVVDYSGKPITDLTREDFTISENGVRQEIAHFSTTRFVAETPAPGARPAFVAPASTEIAPSHGRVFLILLGNGRIQQPFKGVDGLIGFVTSKTLPQDQIAVMAYNRSTSFTTDHARIAKLLERYKGLDDEIDTARREWFSGLRAIYGSSDEPDFIQKLIDRVFDDVNSQILADAQIPDAQQQAAVQRATLDALRTAQTVTGGGDPALQGAIKGSDMALAEMAGATLDAYAANMVQSNQDLARLYAAISYLRHLDGEKHLLFVTPHGLSFARSEDVDKLTAAANNARVVVDLVQTGGMGGDGFGLMDTERVATQTGGVPGILTYADKVATRIADSTSFEYVLGYYPKDPTLDRSYRRIEVKVKKGRVDVLYRHGYYAKEPPAPMDERQLRAYGRVAGALSSMRPLTGLTVRATATAWQQGADRGVVTHITVDPAGLALSLSDGAYHGALEVAVFCGNSREGVIGRAWHSVQLNLPEFTRQRFLETGLTIDEKVPIQPKTTAAYVKVVIYDAGADLVGSAMIAVGKKK